MMASMVVGSFAMCGRASDMDQRERLNPATAIATLGDFTITERLVQSELEKGSQMYGGLRNLPDSFQVQLQAQVMRGIIGNIVQLDLAKKYGIEASDAEIEKLVKDQIDQEIGQLRNQFIASQKLKADATEAQFAEVFKKEQKMDLGEVKAKALERGIETMKSGPDLRIPMASMAISQPLLGAIKNEIKISDTELKQSYDTFELKRITLTKGDAAATAKKIIGELKGGLSFEQAIDRYSEGTPEPKKKLSDKIDPVGRITIGGFEAYKPIANLKPGEYTEPLTIGQSVNIFKLIRIKSDVPKDFDKKKETYRDTQTTSLAAGKLQRDLQKAVETAKITWKSEGYRLLYEYGRLTAENLSAADREKMEKQILADAQKLSNDGEAFDVRMGANLAFVLFQNVYSKATGADKKKLEAEKAQIYESYLSDKEDPALRIELVQLYKAKKDADGFSSQLLAAANGNMSQLDASGQSMFSQINKLIKEGQEAKLLTADQVKEIEDTQKQWVEQKKEQDQYDAEEKKAAEEAKKADEVKTRQEAEKEKKAKAGGKK